MNDRERGLLMQHEIEQILRRENLPALVIIGLPDEDGFVRASYGLNNEANIVRFGETIYDYLSKRRLQSSQLASPPESFEDQGEPGPGV